jgi:hypothetical protein
MPLGDYRRQQIFCAANDELPEPFGSVTRINE